MLRLEVAVMGMIICSDAHEKFVPFARTARYT